MIKQGDIISIIRGARQVITGGLPRVALFESMFKDLRDHRRD
jgi:hypothetical protein